MRSLFSFFTLVLFSNEFTVRMLKIGSYCLGFEEEEEIFLGPIFFQLDGELNLHVTLTGEKKPRILLLAYGHLIMKLKSKEVIKAGNI